MIEIVESSATFEVRERVRPGMRFLFAAVGLVPLSAPYQLIIVPSWRTYFSPIFVFVLLISLGAIAVSALLFLVAIAGLNTNLSFNHVQRTLTYSQHAPVVRMRVRRIPFSRITRVALERHARSEGPDTFSVRVETKDGKSFTSGSSGDRETVESAVRRATELVRTS